jgi:hypothetical protein
MLARVQTWLNRVADWVGGEDPAKAYYAELLIGAHEFRGPTLTFANGKSLTLAADIVQTRQTDPDRLMVLTAKPPPGAVDQRNLFCVNGRPGWYWASPDDRSLGHYIGMEVEPDRLALTTDAGWHVVLGISDGRRINKWLVEHGPRYRVAGTVLTFTAGRAVDFGSRILQTLDAGPVVVVRTERGPEDSAAENIAAVDESRFVWRIPRHRIAKDEKGKPLPYIGIGLSDGRVSAMNWHVTLYCDLTTGRILEVQTWR